MTAPRETVGTAADGEPTPADQPAPASTGSPERSRSLRRLLIGLGVLLGLLTVAAVVLGLRVQEARAAEDRREDAVRYAKQMALNLTSISVKDLDADIQQVLEGATGEFAEDFGNRSENLREVLTTNEVSSEGKVLEAALVRADEDTATALVVVDATVRNAANPDGGVNTYRMKLDLERQGDRWLTSLLEFVG